VTTFRKPAIFDTPEGTAVLQALKAAKTIVLTTHEGPDADGIGSEIALARALRRLGKRVWIRNQDQMARRFRFLDRDDDVVCYKPTVDAAILQAADLCLLVDTGEFRRAGAVGEAMATRTHPTLALDHHAPNGGTIHGILGHEFSSTGELVTHLLSRLGIALSKDIADPLFAAILFDTAQFRFCRNDAEVFATATLLVEAGADAEGIGKALFGANSKDAKLLESRVLNTARFECGGRLVWSVIGADTTAGLSVDRDEVRSMVNILGDIDGVEIACLFKADFNRIKISMRSRGTVPIVDVAEALGGGGHPFAAGGESTSDLETAIATALPMLRAKMT
jgi:phosphoesterase RecJ-like protein